MSAKSSAADSTGPVLEIVDLEVCFAAGERLVRAVNGITLTIQRGEILGLVGESGSGKSVTALSIMGLIRPPGRIVKGQILFTGQDLLKKTREELRSIRGDRIGMIFQDPSTSLNPVLRVGEQVAESLIYHRAMDRRAALERAAELLEVVRIPEPARRLREYPHQLSGGMKQRVMIAMALACNPELIIADEPTTALDVTIQSQILELLNDLRVRYGTSILLITHDIGLVAEMADHVAVMYCGKICGYGEVQSVLVDQVHPYISALIGATPKLDEETETLDAIPGTVPHLSKLPPGCAFSPRCRFAQEICFQEEPPPATLGTTITTCWFPPRGFAR